MQFVTPNQLREIVKADYEFALLDVRERNPFSKEHLLFSSCIPLSQLELVIGDMVPKLSTKVVVIDEGIEDIYDLAKLAALRLEEMGYTDVSVLGGGIAAWRNAGFELFSGVGAYAKAFGEWIAEKFNTPFITPEQQVAMAQKKTKQVIIDCRPADEYHRMTIPGSMSAPGADLVYRIFEAAKDPDTQVLVHCAGRTRGIIGTQTLVNAGIPNPVVNLKNGTMGWQLAGFELEYGQTRSAPLPSPEALDRAKQSAEKTAKRFGVRKISRETLNQWIGEKNQRTTYVIDVRLPHEYRAGHLEGSRNVQGGQLVQATDEFMCVFNSRVVLLDDTEVRAIMTASWLIQMGWPDVYVLENGITGLPSTDAPYRSPVPIFQKSKTVTHEELKKLLESPDENIAVIDLASSTFFKQKHIPDAWWAIRSRLQVEAAKLPSVRKVVLTSEDGVLAHLAQKDLTESDFKPELVVLDGGTKSWIDAGLPVSEGMGKTLSDLDDTWYMPYMHPDAPDELKRAYFEWEYGLVAQIERDGTAKYRIFPE
jgi:rhodanese-related sulfurtransferase